MSRGVDAFLERAAAVGRASRSASSQNDARAKVGAKPLRASPVSKGLRASSDPAPQAGLSSHLRAQRSRASGHEQLELLDPFDDGLDFGAWVESLPLDPTEEGG